MKLVIDTIVLKGRLTFLMLAVFICSLPQTISSQDYFTYASDSLGVDYVYTGVGDCGGVSLVDVNDDGLDDLTFATSIGDGVRVYFQGPDTMTQWLDLSLFQENDASRSVTWVDYDNDGDKDMFVTNLSSIDLSGGLVKLYRRDSPNTLTDVTVSAGFGQTPIRAYSACWADYDNDGWLDVYISHRFTVGGGPNRLMRNQGDGTFVDMAEFAGVLDEDGLTYASIFFDYDLDGDADLYTANDKSLTKNRFFQNEGDGTFTDISESSGIGIPMDGMGLNIGDYDNNGWLDLYVTNTDFGASDMNGGNRMFQNDGGSFMPAENDTILEINFECWGTSFIDIDNDMDLDLFAASTGDGTWGTNRFLFINYGNSVFEPYDGIDLDSTIYGFGFGMSTGDINNDGYADMVMQDNNQGAVEIWKNVGGSNHWVKINLEGTISNRDAVGSLIEVWAGGVKQIVYTTAGSSFASQTSDTRIIGLGANEIVDSVIVHFPSGVVNTLYDLPVDRRYNITEDPTIAVIDCLPEVDFVYSAGSGLEVSVSGSGSSGITDWHYDMGDGGEVLSQNGSYTYDVGGTYTVCLTAENSCSFDSICQNIPVDCIVPQGDFDFTSDQLEVIFSANVQMTDSVHWEFGDGGSSAMENPSYEFEEAGTYYVCLEIYNECGADVICDSVDVNCIAPLSTFTSEIDNLEITFSADETMADSANWTMGDGSTFSGLNGVYAYSSAGEYEVCMTIFNSCESITTCDTIVVDCLVPLADFEAEVDSLVVDFVNFSENADDVLWDYGDGNQSTEWQEQYTYDDAGTYYVCVTASSDCGEQQFCDSVEVGGVFIGLDELLTGSYGFDIYPNPADQKLTLTLQTRMRQASDLMIIDNRGRVLLIETLTSQREKIDLDVAHLTSGSYHIVVSDSKQNRFVRRLVIQH
jgi:PKD repeat protein